MAIGISVIDYFLYITIFITGILTTTFLLASLVSPEALILFFEHPLEVILTSFSFSNLEMPLFPPPSYDALVFVLFWSGFALSIWMWLYVLALFVTRVFLRSERLVNWLRWFLDIEKNPFRSIGAVAAVLAFIANVAILLVSAEVSRIGGAG